MSYFDNIEKHWPLTASEQREIARIQYTLGNMSLSTTMHSTTSIVYRTQAERVVALNQKLDLIKDGVWRRRVLTLIGFSHLDGASQTMLSPPKGVA